MPDTVSLVEAYYQVERERVDFDIYEMDGKVWNHFRVPAKSIEEVAEWVAKRRKLGHFRVYPTLNMMEWRALIQENYIAERIR